MRPVVEIGSHVIGERRPCFVIAEAGVNHDGSIADALALVDAAADSGADAVKFQSFRADALAASSAPLADYQRVAGAQGSQAEMLRRLELTEEDHALLATRALKCGIVFLSTPFDAESARMLALLGVPAMKIGSGEVTNLHLIRSVASLGLPVILSTGMSNEEEVARAVAEVEATGNSTLVLMHCVSAYPAPAEDANLRAMTTLRERFAVPVGFSDHTAGDRIAVAAVALGACVLEKHLTLDVTRTGPDHRASMEPAEFARMVSAVREVELALGDGVKRAAPSEKNVALVARRSLVAVRDIRPGERIDEGMVAARRPATGISPDRIGSVVGRHAARGVAAGNPLQEEDLA